MLRVHNPEVKGATISCKMSIPRSLRQCFKADTFIVEYDESVESCPASILIIAAVMSVAPIAWASNTELSTPPLDESFHRALGAMRDGYAELYPSVFTTDGPVVTCDRMVLTTRPASSRPAILFSGGVDSVAATISILEKSPALFLIHGSDIRLDNHQGWRNVSHRARQFAEAHRLSLHCIRSNFYDILRCRFIDYDYRDKLGRGWWGAIHSGAALPALCAPITYVYGYTDLLLASGGAPELINRTPHPMVIDELGWAGTSVSVADADIQRQDKISRIASYIRNSPDDSLVIRACYKSSEGINCSRCLKCRRTILGMILEDIDPNTVGFHVDKHSLPEIQHEFESGSIHLAAADRLFWQDFQLRVAPDKHYLYDTRGFFKWLSGITVDDYCKRRSSLLLVNIADRVIRRMPYPLNVCVFDRLRALYRFVRKS